ncbi:MAG: hydrogenase maturation nickel metallochaperone HypA [Spirochaetes bacterium]|nr:hydrogenase maturation nickel metallochaperone HypA [Spirochaetota bacterium]
MHELSIAEELLQIITNKALQVGIHKIEQINLKIGEFSGVLPDALVFAFEMLSKDTMTEGVRIEIERSGGNELQVLSFEGD